MYYPNPIKTHIVHADVADIVIEDIAVRHSERPNEIKDIDTLRIDPGGMMCVDVQPKTNKVNGCSVEVNPEHIWGGTFQWTQTRELDETLPSGEKIIKVYMSQYICVTLPESMHLKIGAWLAGMSAEGQVARVELADKLKDVAIIGVPVSIEDEA